jgi:hypothetical protein
VKLAKISDNEFREYLTNANQQRQKAKVKKMTKERAKSNKKIAELDLIIKRLYEDNVLEKISDEQFMILTKSYEQEQSDLKEALESLDEQLAEIEIRNLNSYQFTRLIKQYTEISELTAPLLKELLDKIVIHQSEGNGHKKLISITSSLALFSAENQSQKLLLTCGELLTTC